MYKRLAMLLLFYSTVCGNPVPLLLSNWFSILYQSELLSIYILIASIAFTWPIHHPNPLLLAVYYMINDLSLYINILHCMFELTRVADENRGLNPYSAPLPQHHTPYT